MGSNPIDTRQNYQADDPFGQIHVRNRADEEEHNESDMFKSVLGYCVLILGGPILAFAVTKVFILGMVLQMDTETIRANVTSAVVAVVVLHLALGLFISKAYFGTDAKKKIGKHD
jgi:hypothetical protein